MASDSLETKRQVVDLLSKAGIDATLEYPGFIKVKEYSIGTSNETWGWDKADEDGNPTAECGDLEIPSESENAEEIADAILNFIHGLEYAYGKACGVVCCDKTFTRAEKAWNHERTHCLDMARETLEAILEQWGQKKLAGDFFVLPYELNELVHLLNEECGNRE